MSLEQALRRTVLRVLLVQETQTSHPGSPGVLPHLLLPPGFLFPALAHAEPGAAAAVVGSEPWSMQDTSHVYACVHACVYALAGTCVPVQAGFKLSH